MQPYRQADVQRGIQHFPHMPRPLPVSTSIRQCLPLTPGCRHDSVQVLENQNDDLRGCQMNTVDFDSIQFQTVAGWLKTLQLRDGFTLVREFLHSQEIETKKSWKSINDEIEKVMRDAGQRGQFMPKFHQLAAQIHLCSQKKVYILASQDIDCRLLASDAQSNIDIANDFFGHQNLSRPKDGNHVSYQFKNWKIENSVVYSFVTSRTIVITEEVPPEAVKADQQDKYSHAKLIAKQRIPIRVYDHLLLHEGCLYLLLDCPPHVDSRTVDVDALRYETLIRQQIKKREPSHPFINMLPILKPIYQDSGEGIVNHLQFVSNDQAVFGARYYHGSTTDHRKQKFQQDGERDGAQVMPFQLGLKWPQVSQAPAVLLPGEPDMVRLRTLPVAKTPRSLDYMVFDGHPTWDGFRHVVSRIHHHLELVKQNAAQAPSPAANDQVLPVAVTGPLASRPADAPHPSPSV